MDARRNANAMQGRNEHTLSETFEKQFPMIAFPVLISLGMGIFKAHHRRYFGNKSNSTEALKHGRPTLGGVVCKHSGA